MFLQKMKHCVILCSFKMWEYISQNFQKEERVHGKVTKKVASEFVQLPIMMIDTL